MCMLSAASPICIHTTHFSTKRREFRHEDFLNTRHTTPHRLFQSVHLERCVTNIHPYSLFLHEATGASSRRLLKHTAHSAAPSVSKCASVALRHQYTPYNPFLHEATGASSRRLLKHTAYIYIYIYIYIYGCILVTQRSKCTFWNRRRGAVCHVFQKSSWRSSRRFVGIWVETDGAALCAVCFKSLRDEDPVASWGNGLYGYILATQRSRLTFWDRRRGTACRLFQKSLWRCSRRFVEKWVVWMDSGDAALDMHILKPTAWRCVPCVSKVFVTKLSALRGRGYSYLTQWWHCKSFETDGHLIDLRYRRLFQICVHVAPGVAWRSAEWPLLKHRAYHSVPCVSKRSVTMRRERRGEAMSWILLKHTAPHTTATPASYVTARLSRKQRSLLAKLRSGTLPLALETGRYTQTPVNQRLCRSCNTNAIETELHFLFECDRYNDIRTRFPNRDNATQEGNHIEELSCMFSDKDMTRNLALYMQSALELRTHWHRDNKPVPCMTSVLSRRMELSLSVNQHT